MTISDSLRASVLAQGQGAMTLQLAFIGVTRGLFERLASAPGSSPDALASQANIDAGYTRRWCEAAFAFGLLDEKAGAYTLTELGAAFRPSVPGTLMPFAIQAVLGAHMADRASELMLSGERPGESVLAERSTILPWFGPMLEASFAPFFEREILPTFEAIRELDAEGAVAVDLGCGNGWYLRKLLTHFKRLRGIGLDGFDENIQQARAAANAAGFDQRLSFQQGDIYHYTVSEPVAFLSMSRALHHVWDQREKVFGIVREALAPGGVAVIWEPRWPDDLTALREPGRRGMAFQNLAEHVQGNHFLRPAEIESAMREAGLSPRTFLFAGGAESVVVGTRTA